MTFNNFEQMKKILLLLVTCLSMNAFAQEDIATVKKVIFYGVDFSHANLYGFEENPTAIRSGLEKINDLFIRERKKYDISKYFKKEVLDYCLESTDKNNAQLPVDKMLSNNKYIELSDNQLQKTISGFSCNNNECGLVLVAENLNKQDEKATYLVVFFDGKTKKIIYSKRATGKAIGFGIRNHWASSIYKMMKGWKY